VAVASGGRPATRKTGVRPMADPGMQVLHAEKRSRAYWAAQPSGGRRGVRPQEAAASGASVSMREPSAFHWAKPPSTSTTG